MNRGLTALMMGLWCGGALWAQATQPEKRYTVEHDTERVTATLRINCPDGQLAWADVIAGLAEAKGYGVEALEGVLPDKTRPIDSRKTRLMILATDRLLGDGVTLRVEREENADPVLVLTLDRLALLESKRRFTSRVRRYVDKTVGRWGGSGQRYGLRLDEGWADAPPERTLVVMLHGINSDPNRLGSMLAPVRAAGLPCATFCYPNDQPIADSAGALAEALRKVKRDNPQRKVALLTHSMGGLVAREAIENKRLDPGNVERLIMIAPPTHGSNLAPFAFAIEWVDHITDGRRVEHWRELLAWVEDGLGEASDDLTPGSAFLTTLNGRERNASVSYTLLLGTGAPMKDAWVDKFRASLVDEKNTSRFARLFGPKLEQMLGDLDEVRAGKGDGAVAVERGRLAGVDDTILLPFDHLRVMGDGDTKTERAVRDVVYQRLGVKGAAREAQQAP